MEASTARPAAAKISFATYHRGESGSFTAIACVIRARNEKNLHAEKWSDKLCVAGHHHAFSSRALCQQNRAWPLGYINEMLANMVKLLIKRRSAS